MGGGEGESWTEANSCLSMWSNFSNNLRAIHTDMLDPRVWKQNKYSDLDETNTKDRREWKQHSDRASASTNQLLGHE